MMEFENQTLLRMMEQISSDAYQIRLDKIFLLGGE